MSADHLLALAAFEHQDAGGPPSFAVGEITGPVHLDQLGAALGCWFVIDHPGLDDPGTKTVVAACPQAALDHVLAAYGYDPLWNQPQLAAIHKAVVLAEAVLAGNATFTGAQLQALAARLVLHLAQEVLQS